MPEPECGEDPQSINLHAKRLTTTKIEVQEAAAENDQERRMSVSGDDCEGEEPSVVIEEEEEEISRGPGEGGEGPGEVTGEDVEGEIAHEGREETGGTTCVSVSI